MPRLKRLLLGIGGGIGVGALMSFVMTRDDIPDLATQWPGFREWCILLNSPAGWMAHLWNMAGFPPHGETAMVLLYPCAVVVQWTLIGLASGLAWCWFSTRKHAAGS